MASAEPIGSSSPVHVDRRLYRYVHVSCVCHVGALCRWGVPVSRRSEIMRPSQQLSMWRDVSGDLSSCARASPRGLYVMTYRQGHVSPSSPHQPTACLLCMHLICMFSL
jgi:hypothetical protein